MNEDVLSFLLTLSGSAIALLFLVVGFFLRTLFSDLRKTQSDNIELKSNFDLMKGEMSTIKQVNEVTVKSLFENIKEIKSSIEKLAKGQQMRDDILRAMKEEIYDNRNKK